MAKVIFNEFTDYQQVYGITKLIFGDVAARGTNCCHSKAEENAMCKTASYMRAADIATTSGDEPRYDDAVKIAYLTIYPFADRDYNP